MFTLGTNLPLEGAGQRISINPERLRYHDAIEELEYEGAIEWPTSARLARGTRNTSPRSAAWRCCGNAARAQAPCRVKLVGPS